MSVTVLVVAVVLVVALYLAFKLAGFVLKLGLWCLVAVGVYWLLASQFGWPWPF